MANGGTLGLNCASCGASLDVGAGARFVTCRHCGSSLEVKRSESAEWTELLAQVSAHTGEIRREVTVIRVEQELERLDREWEQRRDELMLEDQHGGKMRPTVAGGVIGIVGIVVLSIVGLVVFGNSSPRSSLPPGVTVPGVRMVEIPDNSMSGVMGFPIAMLVMVGILVMLSIIAKARKYEEEELRYKREREELLRRRG